MRPRLLALKSAVPPYVIAQTEAATYARSLFAQVRDIARLIPVFENTGIARRYSCVPIEWYLGDHGWMDRTQLYVENAVNLLETVARGLLDEAGLKTGDIDSIVVVSTTGVATPSLRATMPSKTSDRKAITRQAPNAQGRGHASASPATTGASNARSAVRASGTCSTQRDMQSSLAARPRS